MTLHLELLRFKRMLDWIVHEVVALFHDGSTTLRRPAAISRTWNYWIRD